VVASLGKSVDLVDDEVEGSVDGTAVVGDSLLVGGAVVVEVVVVVVVVEGAALGDVMAVLTGMLPG
jgi:hypothetical protein